MQRPMLYLAIYSLGALAVSGSHWAATLHQATVRLYGSSFAMAMCECGSSVAIFFNKMPALLVNELPRPLDSGGPFVAERR